MPMSSRLNFSLHIAVDYLLFFSEKKIFLATATISGIFAFSPTLTNSGNIFPRSILPAARIFRRLAEFLVLPKHRKNRISDRPLLLFSSDCSTGQISAGILKKFKIEGGCQVKVGRSWHVSFKHVPTTISHVIKCFLFVLIRRCDHCSAWTLTRWSKRGHISITIGCRPTSLYQRSLVPSSSLINSNPSR